MSGYGNFNAENANFRKMTIKTLLQKLETSAHPVAQAIHKNEHFKVLVLAFRKGMILADHKAHQPSKLTVLSGRVLYREGEESKSLQQYDETDIPVDITHSVVAEED